MNVYQVLAVSFYLLLSVSCSNKVKPQEQPLLRALDEVLIALDTLDDTAQHDETSQELVRRVAEWDTLKEKLDPIFEALIREYTTSLTMNEPFAKELATTVTVIRILCSLYREFFEPHRTLTDVAARFSEVNGVRGQLSGIKLAEDISFESFMLYESFFSKSRLSQVFHSEKPFNPREHFYFYELIRKMLEARGSINEYLHKEDLDSYSKALARRHVNFYHRLAQKLANSTTELRETLTSDQLELVNNFCKAADEFWELVKDWPEFVSFSRNGKQPPITEESPLDELKEHVHESSVSGSGTGCSETRVTNTESSSVSLFPWAILVMALLFGMIGIVVFFINSKKPAQSTSNV